MAQPKKQPRKRGNSVPAKRSVKSSHKGKTKPNKPRKPAGGSRSLQAPPAGHYFAYVNARGQRVKAGTRGARRISVAINRAALSAAAKRHGRVGGKFATFKAAKKAAAVAKGKATRALKRAGVVSIPRKDRIGKTVPFRFRDYTIASFDPDTIRALIEYELTQGAVYFYCVIEGVNSEGDDTSAGTGHFRVKPENADHASNAMAVLASQYEVDVVEEITVTFTYNMGVKQ